MAKKNSQHLHNSQDLPGTALCSLHILTHLILLKTLGGRSCIILTLQMGKLRQSILPEVTQPGRGRAEIGA